MPFAKDPKQIETIARKTIADTEAFRDKVRQGSYSEDELVADVVAKADSVWEGAASAIIESDRTEAEIAAAQDQWRAAWPEEPKPADVRNGWMETAVSVLMGLTTVYWVFLFGFGIFEIYRNWGSNLELLGKWATWLVIGKYVAGFAPLIVLEGLLKWRVDRLTSAQAIDLKRRTDEWQHAILALQPEFGLADLRARQASEIARIESDLTARITEEIRAAINRRTEPSYATFLDIERPRDFGEVSDPRFIVRTPAREALDRLIARLSGGSIGLAGSRGAGKSTLLRSYCGDTRVVTSLRDQNTGNAIKVLGVLVSAPVAYQAREFLLYLFGAACQSALEAEGVVLVEPTLDAGKTPRETARTWLSSPEGQAAPRPLIRYGAMLFLLGLVLSLLIAITGTGTGTAAVSSEPATGASDTTRSHAASPTPASPTPASATPASPTPASAKPASATPVSPTPTASATALPAQAARHPLAAAPAPSSSPSPNTSPATPASTPETATSADFDKFIARWLAAMKIDPGTLLTWGAGSMILGLVVASILGQPWALLTRALPFGLGFLLSVLPQVQRALRDEEERLQKEKQQSESQELPERSSLAKIAEDRLKTIKFQQSYTSGWSGTLKLPLGLEAGTNNAVTMAQNQLSLPEIASSFARFIKAVGFAGYKVVIGIDELDKIATDELARQFINDIKSIFGLQNCFYLVSVSEDAMSSFERRGLPIRDEFDSAFDELLYVEHLKFNVAKTLLEQRVLGRPIPFFALSYCMSGGLPRDLIRSFRKVLEVDGPSPGQPPSLSSVCNQLVTNDIVAKALAVRTAARKIKLPVGIDLLVTAMRQLEDAAGTDDALETQARQLLGPTFFPAPATARTVGEEKDTEAALNQLRDLAEEIATYILFVVALRRFFTDKLTQADLVAAIDSGRIDKLAQARRYLGVNPAITRSMIDGWKASLSVPPSSALLAQTPRSPPRKRRPKPKPKASSDR